MQQDIRMLKQIC